MPAGKLSWNGMGCNVPKY